MYHSFILYILGVIPVGGVGDGDVGFSVKTEKKCTKISSYANECFMLM